MTQSFTNVRAVLTKKGDEFILSCSGPDSAIGFTASRPRMLEVAEDIGDAALHATHLHRDVRVIFPNGQVLTLTAESAAIVADYVISEMKSLDLDPRRN